MRSSLPRAVALSAVALALLAGCGAGDGQDEQAAGSADGEPSQDEPSGDQPSEGQPDGEGAPADPNEDVEDGVYRGAGVVLPVPQDWSLDSAAFQQGMVAATPEDGEQQLTAQAIGSEQAEAAGQPMDLDTLVESVRGQIDQEPDVDEEVDVAGADRAHRLTYRDLPAQQEGGPTSSATIVLAADGSGRIAELAYSATSESYDADRASLLVEQAGIDPDSEPPQPEPAPEGQGGQESDGS